MDFSIPGAFLFRPAKLLVGWRERKEWPRLARLALYVGRNGERLAVCLALDEPEEIPLFYSAQEVHSTCESGDDSPDVLGRTAREVIAIADAEEPVCGRHLFSVAGRGLGYANALPLQLLHPHITKLPLPPSLQHF